MPASATEEEKLAYTDAIVDVVEQDGNKITFQCENIPEIDLPVMLFLGGGSGSGGTDDYEDLINKPKINGITLNGDLDPDDLGLADNDSLYVNDDGEIAVGIISDDTILALFS